MRHLFLPLIFALLFSINTMAQNTDDEYFGEKFLFFDTETSGLPIDYKVSSTDTLNWPHMVQIGWILTDDEGNELSEHNYIVKPRGYTIPDDVAKIHGISTQYANDHGLPLDSVINVFLRDFQKADYIIGHNVSFDQKIVGSELVRLGKRDVMFTKRAYCTMHAGTDYCQLRGKYGNYKWPKLQELYNKLFGSNFDNAHDAMSDIRATCKCFWKMKELGLF